MGRVITPLFALVSLAFRSILLEDFLVLRETPIPPSPSTCYLLHCILPTFLLAGPAGCCCVVWDAQCQIWDPAIQFHPKGASQTHTCSTVSHVSVLSELIKFVPHFLTLLQYKTDKKQEQSFDWSYTLSARKRHFVQKFSQCSAAFDNIPVFNHSTSIFSSSSILADMLNSFHCRILKHHVLFLK